MLLEQRQRDLLLWVLLGSIVAALLAAFWMVCESQVQRAQERHKNQVVEQRAVEDCVRRSSQDSLISCAERATDQQPAAVAPKSNGYAASAR